MFWTGYGIFLSDGAAMDYDTRNAYVLDLSCTDTYDVSTGTFTVNLIRNEVKHISIQNDFLSRNLLDEMLSYDILISFDF